MSSITGAISKGTLIPTHIPMSTNSNITVNHEHLDLNSVLLFSLSLPPSSPPLLWSLSSHIYVSFLLPPSSICVTSHTPPLSTPIIMYPPPPTPTIIPDLPPWSPTLLFVCPSLDLVLPPYTLTSSSLLSSPSLSLDGRFGRRLTVTYRPK